MFVGENLRVCIRINGLTGICQCEPEGRSFIDFRLGPDAATMLANDELHRGQADPRAFEILVPVQALKDAKEFVFVLHVETHAIVTNEEDSLSLLLKISDLNNGALARTGELERIGNQVLKNLLNQNGIALGGGKVRNLPGHRPAFSIRLQQGDDFIDQQIELRALNFEGMTAKPG
jgi:hypothetical protein